MASGKRVEAYVEEEIAGLQGFLPQPPPIRPQRGFPAHVGMVIVLGATGRSSAWLGRWKGDPILGLTSEASLYDRNRLEKCTPSLNGSLRGFQTEKGKSAATVLRQERGGGVHRFE